MTNVWHDRVGAADWGAVHAELDDIGCAAIGHVALDDIKESRR